LLPARRMSTRRSRGHPWRIEHQPELAVTSDRCRFARRWSSHPDSEAD
jgi:hypothetical protein